MARDLFRARAEQNAQRKVPARANHVTIFIKNWAIGHARAKTAMMNGDALHASGIYNNKFLLTNSNLNFYMAFYIMMILSYYSFMIYALHTLLYYLLHQS